MYIANAHSLMNPTEDKLMISGRRIQSIDVNIKNKFLQVMPYLTG